MGSFSSWPFSFSSLIIIITILYKGERERESFLFARIVEQEGKREIIC